MFEKSKSEITFKEFQNKINIVNNFENDWGHFYDPDNNDILFVDNLYLYREPQFPIQKPPIQEPIKTQPIQEPSFDIENQKKEKKEIPNLKIHNKNNKITVFMETIFIYFKTSFITLTMAYFIFKII